MLVAKYFSNKVFDHIDPWGETLESIAWVIRASYRRTVQSTPGQGLFIGDMIFNLASILDWRVITAAKQRQVDIDTV